MARILVIDDEPELVKVVGEILELAGHETLTATDVKTGMVLFDANPIDLVITDILMLEQGGLEMIKQVQSRSRGTKVVAMSGMGQGRLNELLKTGGVFGVDTFMMKPFTLQELLDIVKQVLNI